ncbi:TonB-dependent receptor [Luteibacter sp. PPL201]|uniref:TonB-dependent receptor n=1 Tax=Luteibacter sahnii TaxID=3021977 RepID=A0ABT6BER9_9GAMM|nr:TonB-dependent receptor [Luteibacter sp. PPL193]MDY1549700.1 TonB-dependent receptor [Luteibacter sp. PPL193]
MSRSYRASVLGRRSTLALAIGLATVSGAALAQSTTGSIFGSAQPGATIQISSPSTGVNRQITADASGRYRASNLPLGNYTVNVLDGGKVVDSRKDINLTVGSSSEVSFASAAAGNAQSLESVTVSANALPPIDVSSVDSRTVVTSAQLTRLPLGRNAEAIALLAPGVVTGSGDFGRVVSFGGAGVSENAYYINGYNTTDPLKNLGGASLPYGAIDQQEVYTGGYSAMYGRSDGGVINQVGKRGTNEWHFGGQVLWEPKFLAESPRNIFYPNATLPNGYEYENADQPGTEYRHRDGNKKWTTTYSAYVGGPLIKDKLFLFAAAEAEKSEGVSTNSSASSIQANNHYTFNLPKYYVKLDWNINDSNILEVTGIRSQDEAEGVYYAYDYATHTQGGQTGAFADHTKLTNTYTIGKYTSYLTDDLTFSATYGKGKSQDYFNNPSGGGAPWLSGVTNQNPAITGGTPISNLNPTYVSKAPDARSLTHGLRMDLEWQVGDHRLTGGIDNMRYNAYDEGQSMSGPGYAWIYGRGNPTTPISRTLGVGAPGGAGYYVRQYKFITTTSMSVDQKAYYLEDKWQVNDRVNVTVGVRNDKFTNYNNNHISYVDSGNQWAPRLGAAWDVFGDSTFKVYGNLGRYFLALPNSVAIRGASSSTLTSEYFTYTGIAADGSPTGLAPLGPGPVSANNEYGQPTDPKAVTARNLKSQYQDEAILGFDKAFGSEWVGGAKLTVRKLQAAIDDVCDMNRVIEKLQAQGVNTDNTTFPGCVIFNPGKTNRFSFGNADGTRTEVSMSRDDWGFTDGAKRKYYALDMYFGHPWDGKWEGRIDYTFSRSYGNTEGQVKSDIGQDDISKTQDWDAAALMENSNGLLANDRRHQIKMRGSYALTDEWLLSGVVRVQSGGPKSCLGYYAGPTLDNTGTPGGYGAAGTDPIGYGSSYHFCNGQPYHPGDQRQPWTKNIDLSVTYRPAFADHKLAFALSVFNVTDERKVTQTDATYETNAGPGVVSNTYNMGTYFQTPRFVRLSASYDF